MLLAVLLTTLATAGQGAQTPAVPIEVFKSPTCGCCTKWVEMLRQNGFAPKVTDLSQTDLAAVKAKHNVPAALQSCHTAVVGRYVIEGHTPIADIQRLLKQRPPVSRARRSRDADRIARHGRTQPEAVRRPDVRQAGSDHGLLDAGTLSAGNAALQGPDRSSPSRWVSALPRRRSVRQESRHLRQRNSRRPHRRCAGTRATPTPTRSTATATARPTTSCAGIASTATSSWCSPITTS